jgi:hypothetical protein
MRKGGKFDHKELLQNVNQGSSSWTNTILSTTKEAGRKDNSRLSGSLTQRRCSLNTATSPQTRETLAPLSSRESKQNANPRRWKENVINGSEIFDPKLGRGKRKGGKREGGKFESGEIRQRRWRAVWSLKQKPWNPKPMDSLKVR